MSTKTDKIDRLAELTAQQESSSGASLWKEALKRLRASKMALVGAGIIAVFLVLAIIGPWVAPYAPGQQWRGEVFVNRAEFVGARAENWFGLDHLGRDIFSRMLVGARQTLLLGVISTLIGLSVGAVIGSFSGACATLGGRVGQRIDSFIMRCIDIMLALPSLLLAVSVAAVLGQSITTVMIAIGVVQIPVFARLLRGAMLVQGGSDYVLAAHSLGIRKRRIVLTQIMPNSLSPVIVQATLSLATAIIEAAALSFLGLGNPDSAKNPEWGVMLTQAQNYADSAPMMAVYPALAIVITALGFTLLGEAMREALDPKLRG
ncbi:ABC transporter permease [Streptomyces albidoflavus]|uniref:ABC transporter permease n=1 Tax=Streptomyces albidoflavus TaxID=1886 RepID=UPI0033F5B2F7